MSDIVLSAHQPAYLPWPGYIEKIARADVFVFLDDVQFEKNSFTNRNRIKTANGPTWLTVPILAKGHINKSMMDLRIDETRDWRSKHLKSIEGAYRRCSAFSHVFPIVEGWISNREDSFVDYCWNQLLGWVKEAGITTHLVRSSTLGIVSRKSDLVLDLCLTFNATRYISGALGANYLDISSFEEKGISVVFQNFQMDPYPQPWGEFVPYLSTVDYWFSIGQLPNFGSR